jgi:hypothetical protein
MCETTNSVESLHGVRRKYASKRLNFSKTYVLRANIALLSSFLPNWIQLIMKELDISVSPEAEQFLKVNFYFNVYYIEYIKKEDKRSYKKKNQEV